VIFTVGCSVYISTLFQLVYVTCLEGSLLTLGGFLKEWSRHCGEECGVEWGEASHSTGRSGAHRELPSMVWAGSRAKNGYGAF